MSEIISEHKGTIIEFLGDGILVIFGAPIENKNHALDSVIAAIKMQASMASINEWNSKHNYPALSMGIGINTGETIVGNIGSEKHTRYGVIGKHVNLCGRIESYTIGGQILISPLTKSLISEPLEISNEFEVIPKGIQEPIILSDVSGIGGEYNVHCPKVIEEPKVLEKPIEIEYFQIFEKHVSNIPIRGLITSLSKNSAILSSKFELNPFDNFEIRLDKNVYFKVVTKKQNKYMIRFTSDSSSLLKITNNLNE